jgi:hypothetical protein
MRNPRTQLDVAPTELPAHCVASDKDLAPTKRFLLTPPEMRSRTD